MPSKRRPAFDQGPRLNGWPHSSSPVEKCLPRQGRRLNPLENLEAEGEGEGSAPFRLKPLEHFEGSGEGEGEGPIRLEHLEGLGLKRPRPSRRGDCPRGDALASGLVAAFTSAEAPRTLAFPSEAAVVGPLSLCRRTLAGVCTLSWLATTTRNASRFRSFPCKLRRVGRCRSGQQQVQTITPRRLRHGHGPRRRACLRHLQRRRRTVLA
ncbi:hypothetical protein M885DRAFT_287698 [Pelagophyceae sp. CCMP2097]|nr:hypothetical protein M885DRAFT_287698 [Pelagophyceae sp. CCMP2097]